jgi:hypothetical protein
MLQSTFSANLAALLPYDRFWQHEVLQRYPESLEEYPSDWVSALRSLSADQLYDLERNTLSTSLASGELQDFISQMRSLSEIPLAPSTSAEKIENPELVFMRIKGKKRHEIQTILAALDELKSNFSISEVVDFAGGIGNLAMILAKHRKIPVTSLDFDPALQAEGRRRYTSYRPPDAANVEFVAADILALDALPQTAANALSVGLHTCGSLAHAQLRLSCAAKIPFVLNFSCCYYKTFGEETLLSEFGRASGFTISPVGRTLATRSPRNSHQDYLGWKRVKRYRYLIHLFLLHELEMPNFHSLGNSSAALYQGPFEDYGLEQLRRLGIEETAGLKSSLVQFATQSRWSDLVETMIAMNIIRSFTARPLEITLLLDRAMYLAEQGYQASLRQYFNREHSPRNIGILGLRH